MFIHNETEWVQVLQSFSRGETNEFFCGKGTELQFVLKQLSDSLITLAIKDESPQVVRIINEYRSITLAIVTKESTNV